jgi:hypothetical protein
MKNLEKEYLKVRETFVPNDFILLYLQCFNLLFETEVEDVPSLIREVQTFKIFTPKVLAKFKAEQLLKKNPPAVDPNCAFKKDNLTGYLCHIIRDIIFYSGCICNMSYVMPEAFNTVQHYRYLVEKKAYLSVQRCKLSNYLK